MRWLTRLLEVSRRLLHPRQTEQDLDDEVRLYFETQVDRLQAAGFTREEALRQARIRFESSEQVKEKVRDARTAAAFETTLRDTRYAWRVLRKSPGYTIVAVLTLALGIGANTAIFSLINAVMLRWLPVEDPERLVLLTDPASSGVAVDSTEYGIRNLLSYPEYLELRSHSTVFSGLLAAQSRVDDLDVMPVGSRGAEPIKARTQLVSGEFFQVLGVHPSLGRVFTPQQDQAPSANPVAVISYDFWQRDFGGDPAIIGMALRLGEGNFQILGVTPPGFHGILVGAKIDIWFPITMQAQVLPGRDYLHPRDTLWLQVMARLRPSISVAGAEAGTNVAFQQSLRTWVESLPSERERRRLLNQKIILRPGSQGASDIRGQFADPLVLLMAMVGLLLLIACANLANMMLARASARQREIGVRLALGAARTRIIRQLLTESLIVAGLGGVLGIALAEAGTRLLVALVSTGVSNLGLDVPRDTRVLLFTAAISLATGLVFGLAPAIRGTRLDVHQTLAANTRGGSTARGGARTGRILVVTQVGLSLVLLTATALFGRSFHNLLNRNLGFDRSHLSMLTIDPRASGYHGAATLELYRKLLKSLAFIPGVTGATLSNAGLFGGESADQISLEGRPPSGAEQYSQWTEVGPDYFKTVGIPLLQGRDISTADAARGAPVCVVNQSFVRVFVPNANPIGLHVTDEYPTTRETFEIVGVVADAEEHRPYERKRPRFYANISHPIGTVQAVTFLVRSSTDPASLSSSLRKAVSQVDRSLSILALRTINEQIDRRLITQRLLADLAAFFGLVALLLAAIGLYGVISYTTNRRISEMGIRLALGASRSQVMWMVIRETLALVAIGVAIGLPCALVAARLVSNKLYGLSATEPVSLVTAILALVTAATLAGYLPARRASRIDPMFSLRCE